MAGSARDPLLPTHWFNILHDRPEYVASALPRSRLPELDDMTGRGLQRQQPFSLARQSLNTADSSSTRPLAQTYYYARAGVKRMATGTGAGQWGTGGDLMRLAQPVAAT